MRAGDFFVCHPEGAANEILSHCSRRSIIASAQNLRALFFLHSFPLAQVTHFYELAFEHFLRDAGLEDRYES